MNTEGLERLHRITFSTPGVAFNVAILLAVLSAVYLLKFDPLRFIAFSIVLAVMFYVFKAKFNFRRYSFFLAFLMTVSLLVDVISRGIRSAPSGIVISFVIVTVLYFLSESDVFGASISSLSSLVLYPSPKTLLGVLFGVLFLKYMDREIEGYNVRDYFKHFLLTWVTGDPSYFERSLMSKGVKFKGWVKCLRIGEATLVSTSFHPGPMRNVGGARLVGRINSIENAVYLHSPTDHSLNPVNSEEVSKIVKSISCCDVKLTPMRPFLIESDNYRLQVFPFDKTRLMFVIGKRCIDDLPPELNVEDAMIVDCHNAHCKNFKPNLKELKDLIDEGLRIQTKPCNLRYAFKKYRVETNSICGSISVILLDYGFDKYALVVFDGNNVKVDFRREIEDFCESKGFKAVIASTDNHSKTGISTEFTYLPVGSDERDRIVFDILEDCFKMETKDCDVTFGRRDLEVLVTGERFCKFVDGVGRFGLSVAKVYFALLLLSFLLSVTV